MPNSVRDPIYRNLISGIVTARTRANLTQQTVAERLGRPQSYMAKVEGCERRIDVVEFLQIAKAVDFDPIGLVREAWKSVKIPRGK